jgi:hypothetical protein
VSSDKESVRNDRDRRVGQTFSVYLHFDEKDALDAQAEREGTSANAVLRRAIRNLLGLG